MNKKSHTENIVFGLDIGTRSIVGTVGYQKDNGFIVLAQRTLEHETRAMMDGQIHDIARVGETIRSVKESLEDALECTLTDVCIAAAGRVLRTMNVHCEQEFEEEKTITQEDIFSLNTLGVERAYAEFDENNETEIKFYCVGYSVVKYYLNNYPMNNLENHKAKSISADIIATFLPDEVVDGLYKAVEFAGLRVVNLTLEPIAAIQVAIPEMYRMLNIALVDVGAGTSDISITKDGSIIAYGMIPIAGDNLTETLARYCLVDFTTAEMIKRESMTNETVMYKDIMGLPQSITAEMVKSVLEDSVIEMTKLVSDKLKELNGDKPVSAVFVVGGGGKIPGYTEHLAKELGIAPERVALRGEEVMQNISFMEENVVKDSLLVTPIGICLSFYEHSNNFIFVSFNNQRIKLYDNTKLAVVDAAMHANFPNDGLFPKRGKELNFIINGKQRILRGSLGEAAVITVNGEPGDIYMPIHTNDRIMVTESTAGEPAAMEIGALPEYKATIRVNVNDKIVLLPKFAMVNGELQSAYYSIQENDNIEMLNEYTVKQIAEFMDVILNKEMNIYVNNKIANLETKVYENFSVYWTMESLVLSDYDTEEDEEVVSDIKPENERVQEAGNASDHVTNLDSKSEGQESEYTPIVVLVNQKPVAMKGKKEYIFVDIFDYIDFDLSTPKGKGIATKVNGEKAQYLDSLNQGDVIEIYWME